MPAQSGVCVEVVAVERQPYPLQPDDEHEHQSAASDPCEKAGKASRREGADPEEIQTEHRLADLCLDHREAEQQDDSPAETAEHEGARPPHVVAAVGLDPVGDPDHERDHPECERDVSRPVELRLGAPRDLAKALVRPDGPEQPDRDGDQEDEPPLDRPEHPSEHKADEDPAYAGHLVDPESHAALVLGECIGEYRRGVGDQERGSHSLEDPEHDEPDGSRRTAEPGDREDEREHRVDGEAEVVHPHPAVHVAEPAEAHDQDARDDEEAQDHPQQVEAVARHQRVDPDPPEDVRECDQHDRRVDRRQQDPDRRVGERHPLVAVVAAASGRWMRS